MSKKLIVAGRSSKLSKAQIYNFVKHISSAGIASSIDYIDTFGDAHTERPISQLPITNPFTKEIHQAILDGKVDLGISSLKDVEISDTNNIKTIYFSKRENPRDVLLLSKNAIDKIYSKESLVMGTSSTRRKFLFRKISSDILPHNPSITFKNIRGNITTRIAFLQNGNVDGIILAAAGIIRLAQSKEYHAEIVELLQGVKSILLPITHFPTPPGQGVVIAQSVQSASFSEVAKISNKTSERISKLEKIEFYHYGKGCKEGYGVTHLVHKNYECTFIKGVTTSGMELDICKNFTIPKFNKLFDGKRLAPLFEKFPTNAVIPKNAKRFIVAHAAAINSKHIIDSLKNAEEVWTLGLQTQKKLAEKGIICSGNLEALGISAFDDLYFSSKNFSFLLPQLKSEFYILTYQKEKNHEVYNTIATYAVSLNQNHHQYDFLTKELSKSDAVFWPSKLAYKTFGSYFKGSIHISLLGETFDCLTADGKAPHGVFNVATLHDAVGNG